MVGECSLVAAGSEWYATASTLTGALTVYDRDGHRLGSVEATKLRPTLGSLSVIAASGPYLGVAQGGVVTTTRVRLAPDCLGPAAAARGAIP